MSNKETRKKQERRRRLKEATTSAPVSQEENLMVSVDLGSHHHGEEEVKAEIFHIVSVHSEDGESRFSSSSLDAHDIAEACLSNTAFLYNSEMAVKKPSCQGEVQVFRDDDSLTLNSLELEIRQWLAEIVTELELEYCLPPRENPPSRPCSPAYVELADDSSLTSGQALISKSPRPQVISRSKECHLAEEEVRFLRNHSEIQWTKAEHTEECKGHADRKSYEGIEGRVKGLELVLSEA